MTILLIKTDFNERTLGFTFNHCQQLSLNFYVNPSKTTDFMGFDSRLVLRHFICIAHFFL